MVDSGKEVGVEAPSAREGSMREAEAASEAAEGGCVGSFAGEGKRGGREVGEVGREVCDAASKADGRRSS